MVDELETIQRSGIISIELFGSAVDHKVGQSERQCPQKRIVSIDKFRLFRKAFSNLKTVENVRIEKYAK